MNLRQLWAKALADEPVIADFEVDPYYLLQAVSLVSRPNRTCKRGDVLDLRSTAITQWWDSCVRGLAEGLDILREDCGVVTKDWLPINPLLVTLSAVLATAETTSGPGKAAVRQHIGQWFWCSALGGKYESGPNSQATKDFTELLAWFDGGPAPETVSQFRFDPRALRDTTFRQRALYRGLMCVVLRQHPRDFHTGAPLTGDLIIEGHVDDHHIFPQAWLDSPARATSVPPRLRDCILNRTLIDRKTNARIGKRPPSQYLGDIQQALGSAFPELLRTHLLPGGPDSPLWRDDFEDFLDRRQDAFWREIQTLTGIKEAADLVEAEEELTA